MLAHTVFFLSHLSGRCHSRFFCELILPAPLPLDTCGRGRHEFLWGSITGTGSQELQTGSFCTSVCFVLGAKLASTLVCVCAEGNARATQPSWSLSKTFYEDSATDPSRASRSRNGVSCARQSLLPQMSAPPPPAPNSLIHFGHLERDI